MNKERFLSVSDINKYINYKFEQDINLQEVYLQGEISNFKFSGKHCYFSLKDFFSEISAMFFYPDNLSLNFKPLDGASVQVVGKIQIYQKKGTYAIIVKKMVEVGVGLLYQQYLNLKEKLQKEGLFDVDKKLKLPEFPRCVAVITASTGEAINDIISTFNRRLPPEKIKLYPALVQGMDAPKDLIRALKKVYADNDADAIIIGRGGGSFEDLSCFNDEELARTLFTSKIPTVSAVGHEGDYTICDFVASFRAPTPTGAAMKLSKDKEDIFNILLNLSSRVKNAIKNKISNDYQNWYRLNNAYVFNKFDKILSNKENYLETIINKLSQYRPDLIIKNMEKDLNEANFRLQNATLNIFNQNNALFENYTSKLHEKIILDPIHSFENEIKRCEESLMNKITYTFSQNDLILNNLTDKLVIINPFNIMKKGYSIIYKDKTIVSSKYELKTNDEVEIRMADGTIEAIIK